MRAGVALRQLLRELANNADRLYVLAHSHGGNVLLYALDDAELEQEIDGMVFMATPFLHFHRHNFSFSYIREVMVLLTSFTTLIPAMIFRALREVFPWKFMDELSPVSIGVLVLLAVLGFGFWRWAVRTIDYYWRPTTESKRICREFQPKPPNPNVEVLIVRHTGDEASLFLNGGSLVELLMSTIWKISQSILYPIKLIPFWLFSSEKRTKKVFVVSAILIAAALLISPATSIKVAYIGLLILFLAVLAIGTIHVLLAFGILVLNVIRFGWYGISASAFVRVSSEATPIGRWPVELCASQGGGLAHSEAYQDPQVVDRIIVWLRGESSDRS
ncbi:MAG: hypothetical protein K0U72_18015 [Gammaproteobacteria bacterium]|nr:hypothetical protein [Gammaproteobacteria bacterium]